MVMMGVDVDVVGGCATCRNMHISKSGFATRQSQSSAGTAALATGSEVAFRNIIDLHSLSEISKVGHDIASVSPSASGIDIRADCRLFSHGTTHRVST